MEMRVYRQLIGLLLPRRCAGCGAACDAGFCAGCRAEFAPAGRNQVPGVAFITSIAPFSYAEPLKGYIHALKFGGRRSLGRALGELLVDELALRIEVSAVDAIVAVPLHRSRLIERGYNQALELARPLASEFRRPLLVSGIRRVRPTTPQSRLAATQRRRNLRSAFSVSRRLDGLNIAVVDDVMTTGATLQALSDALRSAGAASIVAWVLARA
jgi:ComF family protein